MKEQLALLLQLQTMDLKREKDREVLKAFPEKMAAEEKPLLDARSEIEDAQARLQLLEKEGKENELALQIIEDKIIKLKLRLTELKTNKEYHAHLQEIAAARNAKSGTEDQLIAAMEDGDSLRKEISEKEAVLSEDETQFAEIKKELQAEMDEISSSAAAVEAEWTTTSKKISDDLLSSYKRLFISCNGRAVVSINGSTCMGCHFSLPPQLIAEVKQLSKIHTCGYCHRILYIKPSEDVPA